MPKLSSFRIIKKAVDSLVADRDAIYFDADLRGFAVRTKPSGSKTYLVQYLNREGRTRRVTIGQHGALTPAQAREQAEILLGRVAKGEDPAEDRAEDRKAMTVRQLCEAYLAATEKGLILGKRGLAKKASTLATDRGRIERHILPLMGTRKVRELTTPDINKFMRDVAIGKTAADIKTGFRGRAIVEGGKGTAARTVGLLGGILSYAVSEGIIASNPARGVKRPADAKRQIRLSAEQYKALGDALSVGQANGEPWQAIAAIKLLALTGCRRGEIEGLRWEDVDLTGHCLRLSDSKTGKSVRPLGAAAIRILRDLQAAKNERLGQADANKKLTTSNPHVLPGLGEGKAFAGLPKAWLRLMGIAAALADEAKAKGGEPAYLTGLTPHGLRHAFASSAHDIGLTEITVAALLGHASGSVTGRYIHQVDTALVAAADRVGASIVTAMFGKPDGGEIVDLSERRTA